MAGYGASLTFDEEAMRNLPVGKDPASVAERKKMFRLADMNGNGITSLAECDRLIVSVLNIEGVKIMKPVINRAFHAARDIVPAVGSISPHYVDFHEFRYFLIYLKFYLELFLLFAQMDSTKARGKYSDRRVSYPEFELAVPQLLEWGLTDDVSDLIQEDPQAVWRDLDANGGGVVLFDEFAHWALWHHMFNEDGKDDRDMEEALEVLRKQKPNLCGKDLTAIRASKAKYRADARISGQGCLGGDPSMAGGYDDIPDGGKELAAGRHYPGGLAGWQASFHGQGEDRPGRYRTVGARTIVNTECDWNTGHKVEVLPPGTEIDVEEVAKPEGLNRVRARIAEPEGWISLLNTRNAFRWAVRLKNVGGDEACAGKAVSAWAESLARVKEADNAYERTGIPECIHGCGQPRFGRYPTCCTHCRGTDGPHARSCVGEGYKECVHGCGHPQFGKYDTCCTGCRGPDGPHKRGCYPISNGSDAKGKGKGSKGRRSLEQDVAVADAASAPTSTRSTGRWCENGCGRSPFKAFPTCCTRCRGQDGPHARDCDRRAADEGPRKELRKLFYSHKDRPQGLSYGKFKDVLGSVVGEDDIDAVIATCDQNRNGVIEIDEFMDWLWSGVLDASQRSELARDS